MMDATGSSQISTREDRRNALLCALAVMLAILATLPFLEMGLNDDWSYSITARELARTGHFVYNGWATAMLGIQVVWAALFIRLFGFSFTLVRLTMLPFAAGCAALLYALHRRVGATPVWAIYATLCVVLSPVFTPCAASFMTDIPGLFFVLACVYAAVRAAESSSVRAAICWLAVVALSGIVGGTVRQIVWAIPIPLLIWADWRRARVPTGATAGGAAVGGAVAVLSLVTIAAAVGLTRWYTQQPYALSESPTEGVDVFLRAFPVSLVLLLPFLLSTCLFTLPIVALAAVRKAGPLLKRSGLIPSALTLLICLGGPSLALGAEGVIAPWLRNIVTLWGVTLPGETLIGARPQPLPLIVWDIVSLLVGLSLWIGLLSIVETLSRRFRKKPAEQAEEEKAERRPMPAVLAALLVMAIVYTPLLLPRAAMANAFDRYMLPLMPLATVVCLCSLRGRQNGNDGAAPAPPSIIAWIGLALFCLYGIAATHDYIAIGRARVAAAQEVIDSGVPRTEISAGIEYDGQTQVDVAGYGNDKRILNPPDAYQPYVPVGPYHPLWFEAWTPRITPRYYVVLSPQKELVDSHFAPVPYTAWLPPGRREVLVQTLPE